MRFKLIFLLAFVLSVGACAGRQHAGYGLPRKSASALRGLPQTRPAAPAALEAPPQEVLAPQPATPVEVVRLDPSDRESVQKEIDAYVQRTLDENDAWIRAEAEKIHATHLPASPSNNDEIVASLQKTETDAPRSVARAEKKVRAAPAAKKPSSRPREHVAALAAPELIVPTPPLPAAIAVPAPSTAPPQLAAVTPIVSSSRVSLVPSGSAPPNDRHLSFGFIFGAIGVIGVIVGIALGVTWSRRRYRWSDVEISSAPALVPIPSPQETLSPPSSIPEGKILILPIAPRPDTSAPDSVAPEHFASGSSPILTNHVPEASPGDDAHAKDPPPDRERERHLPSVIVSDIASDN